MKKPFTLLPIFIAVSISVYSQSFNLSISGGYCLPVATDFRVVNITQYQTSGNPPYYTGFEQVASGSYGNGENLAASVDWFSKINIGCGLKFNALFSAPFSYSSNVNYTNGVTANFNYTDNALSLQFIPHISLKHDFKVVSPVMEMGMLIGLNRITEYYEAQSATNGLDVEASNITLNGGVMLGFYSSLGVMFNVSKIAKITLSVNCSVGSYSPTKWQRTSFTVNGADQLSSLPVSEVQGSFVKQLDLSVPQSSSQPDQELKFSNPFSNIGFNAGVCFVIPNKHKEHATEEKKANGFHGF